MSHPCSSWLRALAACLLLSAPVRPIGAQAAPPGADLPSVHAWLEAHSAALEVRELDARAARARAQAAGALPEPMFELELDGIDRARPRALPAQVDSSVYRLRQQFPLWGKRALQREIAGFEADAAGLRRDAEWLELAGQADLAWVRWWYARAGAAAVGQVLGLMEQMRELAHTRYAAGLAPQQDALRAEVELTRMRREAIELDAQAASARAALNASLGRAPDAALAAPLAEPEIAYTGTLDGLLADIAGEHPLPRSEAAMQAARAGMAEELRRERWPDLGVSIGLMQMGNRLEGYELMFEVEIPLQWGARRQRERAAELRAQAAAARERAAIDALRGRAGAAHAMWLSADERETLVVRQLLPQARAGLEAALAGYEVDAVDFDTLLQALQLLAQAERDRLDARRERLQAAIELKLLNGELP